MIVVYLCIFCIVDVDFFWEIIKIALVWRLKNKYKKFFVRVFSFSFFKFFKKSIAVRCSLAASLA